MKPRLILATIAGGAAGVATFMRHRRRPGRHAVAGQHLRLHGGDAARAATSACSLGIVVAAACRFAVAAVLLGFGRAATTRTADAGSTPDGDGRADGRDHATPRRTRAGRQRRSRRHRRRERHAEHQRQGRPQARRRLRRGHGQQRHARQPAAQAARRSTTSTVEHTPVNSIPADADVVVCHAGLADRARGIAPDKRRSSRSRSFIGDPAVTKVVNAIKNGGEIDG